MLDTNDYFPMMALGAPAALPNIYWDAYSNEERIKRLCDMADQLSTCLNGVIDAVNAMDENQLGPLTVRLAALERRVDSLESTVAAMAGGSHA